MGKLKLEITTPERMSFSGQVDYFTVDGQEGQPTILAVHAPLIAALKVGNIMIRHDVPADMSFSTAGFLEVRPCATLLFFP